MRFIYTKTFIYFSVSLVLAALFTFIYVKGYLGPIKYVLLQAPRPIAYATSSVARPVKNFFGTIYTLKKIVRDNSELENKVRQLQQEIVLLDQYRLQNEALKKELGFASKTELSLINCGVLSRDPSGFTDTLVLSCGEKGGVKVGQGVVSQGYLVGKIILTSTNTSTALLLTNAQSSVDAKVSKNDTAGVVKGSFGSGLVLDLVSQTSEVNPGDVIVTAGINSQIPKNILIGEAGDLLSVSNDLFKKRSVVSPIDFRSLDFVFVIK